MGKNKMIKLIDLLEGKKEEKYPPYMYSPVGLGYRDWETDRKSTRLNSSH